MNINIKMNININIKIKIKINININKMMILYLFTRGTRETTNSHHGYNLLSSHVDPAETYWYLLRFNRPSLDI